jgi:hypothetical protein
LVRALQDAGLQADGSSLSFELRSGDQQQRHPAYAQSRGQLAGRGGSEAEAGPVRAATLHISPERLLAGGVDMRI